MTFTLGPPVIVLVVGTKFARIFADCVTFKLKILQEPIKEEKSASLGTQKLLRVSAACGKLE